MDHPLASKSLPPGFRFHPTDEELFMFYLKRKVLGKSLRPQMISELDVYQFGPWDLQSFSSLKTKDLYWYFFCPRSKKYSNGGRTNRSTEHGYWKSTGNDRTVKYDNRPVGKIKTLIFHTGKPPNGDRTDWVMHEYRLEDKLLADKGIAQDAYVICKVYKKSGLGPRNGENYGALFVEEEWESDDDENIGTLSTTVPSPSEGVVLAGNPSTSGITNGPNTEVVVDAPTPTTEQPLMNASVNIPNVDANAANANANSLETESEELSRLLAMFTEDGGPPLIDPIFYDLGDISYDFGAHPSQGGLDWSDIGDCYLELNDLL